jgi:penicillin-binding protein 1A
MVVAHQGVEVKDIAGVGSAQKLPDSAAVAMSARQTESRSAPPILTKRGADILVQVEKLLDEAAKSIANVPPKPPSSTTSLAFPDSFASATPGGATKN